MFSSIAATCFEKVSFAFSVNDTIGPNDSSKNLEGSLQILVFYHWKIEETKKRIRIFIIIIIMV